MNCKISVFDLDHTLSNSNTSLQFGKYLYRKEQFKFPTMVKMVGNYFFHKAGIVSLQSLHQYVFRHLFLYSSKSEIQQHLSAYLKESFEKLLNYPVLDRLRQAQQDGHCTVILSSSPDFLVEPFAERLNVNYWWGTPYHTYPSQEFSSIGKILCGQEKARRLAQLMAELDVDKRSTFAYSDSYLDLPLLQMAGNPVAVNPDRKLKKISRQNNWEILSTSY